MNNLKKIYIASPLGFSEAGRFFLYEKLVPLFIKHQLQVIDPWALTSSGLINRAAALPSGEERTAAWRELNTIIARNNEEGIIRADGMFAVLDGTDVDSGTAAEIGFAAALGKPVTAYRGDFRLAGDNEGSLVNLQVAWFIEKSGGKITTSLAGADDEIIRMFT